MKMSDALRGAAETAPVGDVHVSVGTVRSRARRARAVRVGANGVMGVGAAAIVLAGVMGVVANQTGVAAAGPESGGDNTMSQPNVGSADIAVDPAKDAVNACGTAFDASAFVVDPATATITVNKVGDDGLDHTINTTAAVDAEYLTGHPHEYVLWNGIVVAGLAITLEGWGWTSVAGETTTFDGVFPLVNCWDGAALPAGDYTIVSAQDITLLQDAPPVSEEPLPTTSVDPAADPDASVSSDEVDLNADAPTTTIVSEPAPFTIAGDAVDNPFDEYLKVTDPEPLPEPTVPAAPSDALTFAEARAAYRLALTSAPWNMDKGTHRVVMTSSSDDPNGDMWADSYYGCPSDGTSGSFPASSANLNWLDVTANLPTSVGVSYGWVVNGNPLIHASITNTSDWALPGFYDGTTPRLVLVKDGKVVAEAYPVSPEQGGGYGIAYAADDAISSTTGAEATSSGGDSLIYAPAGDGYLASGESQSGDYLWRDVNGCWTGDSQPGVGPGTYTVLTAQDIYVGNQYMTYDEGDPAASEGSVGAGPSDANTDKAIAPAPVDNGEYASFQVWTSLGTITITN